MGVGEVVSGSERVGEEAWIRHRGLVFMSVGSCFVCMRCCDWESMMCVPFVFYSITLLSSYQEQYCVSLQPCIPCPADIHLAASAISLVVPPTSILEREHACSAALLGTPFEVQDV